LPLLRKRRTIWQIPEIQGYLNKVLGSQIPPDYDVGKFNETHQSIDKLIRENWEYLHPITQDFIYSWFLEYQSAQERKKENKTQLISLLNERTATQQKVKKRLEDLNKVYSDIDSEMRNLQNILHQKKELVQELSQAVENRSIGEEELKTRMNQRILNMHERMVRQQEKFQTNQIKIGNQFKTKVIELDNEKIRLTEMMEKNQEIIIQLEKENEDLKKKNKRLKDFRSRLISIKKILESIPAESLKEDEKL